MHIAWIGVWKSRVVDIAHILFRVKRDKLAQPVTLNHNFAMIHAVPLRFYHATDTKKSPQSSEAAGCPFAGRKAMLVCDSRPAW